MQNGIINILDFDGVICKSTEECMVTAYNAWNRLNGNNEFNTTPDDIPSDEAAFFRKGRGYVRGGGEYYILLKSIKEKFKINDQKHFNSLAVRWAKDMEKFSGLFYESRKRLMNQGIQKWVALHSVFSELADVLKKHSNDNKTFIVTMKDRESILTILKKEGIGFPYKKVFDKDDFNTKLEALLYLSKEREVPVDKIRFLDDNVMHLLELAGAGINVFMADWGYHTDEHIDIAKEKGIKIIKLSELETFFRTKPEAKK